MKTCAACGQTLPSELPGVALSAEQRRIVDRVRRAGPHGIHPEDLFDFIYRDDPDGGPETGIKTLHVRVMFINRKLKSIGKVIRSGWRNGGSRPYVYRDLKKGE